MTQVSIIFVSYNSIKFLKEFLDSLYSMEFDLNKVEIIMIENQILSSKNKTPDEIFVLSKYPKVKILKNNVNNYSKAINLGISKSKGEYILLINPDMIADRNLLKELINTLNKDKKIGSVQAKIDFIDFSSTKNLSVKLRILAFVSHFILRRRIINSMGIWLINRRFIFDRFICFPDLPIFKEKKINLLSGGCVLYKKKCLDKIGSFDESINIYLEDVDMCLRMKLKNWECWINPKALVYHKMYGSGSKENSKILSEKGKDVFFKKWPNYKEVLRR